MNGSTVRNLLKCGYSLGPKDISVYTSKSRILYNHSADRNHCTSWPKQQKQRYTLLWPSVEAKHWNVNRSGRITFDHRCFSTTSSQNVQIALKPKTPERNGNKKQPKDKEKSVVDDKAENRLKADPETEPVTEKSESITQSDEKLTLTARFKKMYKEYWYVLLPVHVVTSTFWIGGFYYLSTSGVDIPALLETMHFNEAIISKLRDSSLGHAAVAYLCYKIATPIRYTVTLGGTTLSIKYLSKWGYIRPVPSKAQLKQMYEDQKDKLLKKD